MTDRTATTGEIDEPRPDAARHGPAAERSRWFERHPGAYLLLALVITLSGLGAIAFANRLYAPEMYGSRAPLAAMAQAMVRGDNYAVFDLNLNIRELRDEHIQRMESVPDVIVLGASHWQEGHAGLLPGYNFYNSHVHRDYYEDMLGVTELWVRHKKLPRKMIITIRDNLFTPVAERRDHLWLPGIPYYRAMARRLWLEPHGAWETLPVQRGRELLSLQMLFNNAERWHGAKDRPRATGAARLKTLDLLLPDGSIVWSQEHLDTFTPERAEKLAASFADQNRNRPPQIDPKGVEAIDTLLTFLGSQGVTVYLAHPPFSPIYYNRLSNSPYVKGLRRIEALTRELAERHGLEVIGSFDPAVVGCEASQYIDAEHANAQCLGKILQQFAELDAAQTAGRDRVATAPPPAARPLSRTAHVVPHAVPTSGRAAAALAPELKQPPAKRLVEKRRPAVVVASSRATIAKPQDEAGAAEAGAVPRPAARAENRPASQRVARRLAPAMRSRADVPVTGGQIEHGQ